MYEPTPQSRTPAADAAFARLEQEGWQPPGNGATAKRSAAPEETTEHVITLNFGTVEFVDGEGQRIGEPLERRNAQQRHLRRLVLAGNILAHILEESGDNTDWPGTPRWPGRWPRRTCAPTLPPPSPDAGRRARGPNHEVL